MWSVVAVAAGLVVIYGLLGVLLRGRREPASDVGNSAKILQHSLDLGRLAERIEQERRANNPGKMARITASVMAYDRVLIDCCVAAGVQTSSLAAPLSAQQRLDVELALLQHEIEW